MFGVKVETVDHAADALDTRPWTNLSIDTSFDPFPTATPHPLRRSRRIQMRSRTTFPPTSTSSNHLRSGAAGMPLQPGALPERYTADLHHWQSPADLPERRLMVQRIIAMTKHTSKRLEAPDRTPSLAKRIELSLYSRAASFNEYRNLNTLRRRLQSLVSLSFHEAAVAKRNLGKRRHVCVTPVHRQLKQARHEYSTSQPHSLLDLTDELRRHIFGFLPGTETIKCKQLNHTAHAVLPSCVRDLEVEVRQLQTAFRDLGPAFLRAYPNLSSLAVHNDAKPRCDQFEAGPALHAWGCSELDISHDNSGEEVVQQVAEAIELGAGRKLRSLRLVSVFTNTCRGNALHLLCAALVKGSCPLLEDLLIGGNGFSDVGTVDVAWLLKVGSLPKLKRLDIRRNYIGESGLKRLMGALQVGRCSDLQFLCVGGNIITDSSVNPVVELLQSAKCPHLRFLGLEDNFLSGKGVNNIIEAAMAGGMMPKLHHVAYHGGQVLDREELD